ncbi:hypothetical protein QMA10_13100 [Arthrobacter sp. APC 3897]|uniref:hypothetical protein n=1 Tax=Arthrobacter sp. APC 3897 TaxID=3035204 RepID=UPI0025B5A30C|nr:hypothetical protein [Arthrobacter sp. APC 3897]MDN3482859.1 hypothetical protein [Arthrobacter sp. APC 3897]
MEWMGFWSSLIIAALGIGGVLTGQWLSSRNEHGRRKFDFENKRNDDIRAELLELYVQCLDALQDYIVTQSFLFRGTASSTTGDRAPTPQADGQVDTVKLGAQSIKQARAINKLMYKVDLLGSHDVRMCFKDAVQVAMTRPEMDRTEWTELLGKIDANLRVFMRRDLELHRPSALNVNGLAKA